MVNSLLAAVYARVGSAVAQVAPGGVYWGAAPTGTAMPYVVLRPRPSFGFEENTSDTFTEYQNIRCLVQTNGAAVAGTIIALLEIALRDPLPLTVGAVLHCNKSIDDLQLEPERDASGQEVWQGIIDFEFLVQRNPGD